LHTVGSLLSGATFENSRERNQLVALRLGQDMPIAGFTQGTAEVRKGDRFKLVIPADQAFGPQGNQRFKVPANAWLAYDIEVVNVEAPLPAMEQPVPSGNGPVPPKPDNHDHSSDPSPAKPH
jgi:FKBP-type peptidyl-prolyl cis-trans isomerase FkpA